MKPKLSVAMATFNEEKNIGSCLKTVHSWTDEIIIVDGRSTDKTTKIAQKYGAKVIDTTNKPIFHINKQMAINAATGDWILQLDADERVSPSLREEILAAMKAKTEFNGYWLPRRNFFMGRWMKKGGLCPDCVIRFFKKGKGRLPCQSVHEQIEIDGPVGYFQNELIHYPFPDFSEYLVKANRYSSLLAQEYQAQGLRTDILTAFFYIFILPAQVFFKLYCRHLGFLDGMPGFVFALFSGLQKTLAYFKYWEMIHRQKMKKRKR